MSFRMLGLDPAPFLPLYGLPDAAPGESMILLDHVHQPAATPCRASHAILVREGAVDRCDLIDRVPEAPRRRPISLRAFDGAGDMADAALIDGAVLDESIARLLAAPRTAYLHAHYAASGCYAARIERA